jgi:hypothetical protein
MCEIIRNEGPSLLEDEVEVGLFVVGVPQNTWSATFTSWGAYPRRMLRIYMTFGFVIPAWLIG